MSLQSTPRCTDDPDSCRQAFNVSCSDCRLKSICLPIALEAAELNQLDDIIQRNRPLQKGQFAYREDQAFQSLFALRAGSLKAYKVTSEGGEQITGFYLPGELFGVDGISQNRHRISIEALETSAICEIPFSQLEELGQRIPGLTRHVFRLMSQEITEDQQLITLLSKKSAQQRLAALLVNLSQRSARLHRSATAIRLPMSRADIGNYLGLTVETVSRLFSRLQKDGIIDVEKREIRLLDLEKLESLAGF